MNIPVIKKVVLIGAGNLAGVLGKQLLKKGFVITQVYSRSLERAEILANELGGQALHQLNKISKMADLYIVCVSDDAIAELASKLRLKNKLVIHTSGSVNMQVLKPISANYGVLYPLQTFSLQSRIKWSKTPILIEAATDLAKNMLGAVAISLSKEVHEVNSHQRLQLHLAAVFCCNFSNHLYHLAKQYLEHEKIPLFQLLHPIIQQTAKKIKKLSPQEAQTGPALRNDQTTIKQHEQLLKAYPTHLAIYKILTQSIITTKKEKNGKLQK